MAAPHYSVLPGSADRAWANEGQPPAPSPPERVPARACGPGVGAWVPFVSLLDAACWPAAVWTAAGLARGDCLWHIALSPVGGRDYQMRVKPRLVAAQRKLGLIGA